MTRKTIVMICMNLILILVFAGCETKKESFSNETLEIEYIDEYDIENNISEEQYFYGRTTPDIIYIKQEKEKPDAYVLESSTFSQFYYEIQEQYNIDVNYETEEDEYLIISYGSKIDDAYIRTVCDSSMEEYYDTTFDVDVIYNEAFDENKLYLYKINRTDLKFRPITSIIAEYGEDNQIKLVQTRADTVDLNINVLWEKNPYTFRTSYDSTREIKIYYYKYQEPYLYTINKWGRYMVIDTDTNKIVYRSYNIKMLFGKHRKVFENKIDFIDISYLDDNHVENTYELGDGTLYFSMSTINSVSLINEIDRRMSYATTTLSVGIEYCLIEEEYIYITDEYGYYTVIDRNKYKIYEESTDLNSISNRHREVFNNIQDFLTDDDLIKLIEEENAKHN